MVDRGIIGRVSGISEMVVERIPLVQFARAIGETNPIFFDQAAAVAAGYPDVVAPPTFVAVLEGLLPPSGLSISELGLPIAKLLHGEQSFSYFKPIYAGDCIRLQSRVLGVHEKKEGALEFVDIETTATMTDGTVSARVKYCYVIRNS